MSDNNSNEFNRRDFVKTAMGAGALAGIGGLARPAHGRIVGANDRINLGFIGVGGRGRSLLREALGMTEGSNVQVVAISDVYAKRNKQAAEMAKAAKTHLDYREIISNKGVDAVVIATPDHWHAKMAIEAMEAGKDVYLEKPMTRTVDEAREVHEATQRLKRVLQVGSQTASQDQWWKARKALQDGMIGKLLMSQGSYHRNSTGGEWNWPIDSEAGPDSTGDNYVDWKMWLGSAPKRPWTPDRFFRFRKYWDYSGGIATDLFYHVVAPLQLVWGGGEFPTRVTASGGIYQFKDEREVPDTFHLVGEYPNGHSLVLSSSLANSTHVPGLLRGHDGTIMMVEHGRFEGRTDYITITPERHAMEEFKKKYGSEQVRLPVEKRPTHMQNFFDCVRSREKPVLDSLTAFKAMTTIAMAVESYREGRVLYFDEQKQRVVAKPTRKA